MAPEFVMMVERAKGIGVVPDDEDEYTFARKYCFCELVDTNANGQTVLETIKEPLAFQLERQESETEAFYKYQNVMIRFRK